MEKFTSKIAVVLFAVLVMACGQKDGQNRGVNSDNLVEIRGEVLKPQSETVILEKIVDNQLIGIDTAKLDDDNKFHFAVEIDEPDFFRLNIGELQKRIIILNENDLNIVAGGSGMNDSFEVTGSLEMDQIQTIDSIIEQTNQKVVQSNNEYMQAQNSQDLDRMNEIARDFQSIRRAQVEALKTQIENMKPTIAVISALSYLPMDEHVGFIDTVFNRVYEKYPTSQHVLSFRDQLENARKIAIGQVAPDLHLPNPKGDTISLSSLRGKVVLIDFWAAWCAPCRKENPNVVKVYNEYKDDGFEIYGVSLDRSREAWTAAIKEDKLPWIQVSDLKYFDSQAAAIYNVEGIPFTVLLDREGKIIAKNLRGKSLEDKLKEIFG